MPKPKKFRPQLLPYCLDCLKERPVTMTFEKISNATGLSVPWLAKLASGRCPDPSVNKVELLLFFLTGEPLFETDQ